MIPFKLIIAYDGTHYFGWQKTASGPSVQESLERALFQITGERFAVEAASRTDRGVHAEGQVVYLGSAKMEDPAKLQRALNGVLPFDIRVVAAFLTSDQFHPTLDASGKEYHYRLCLGPVQDPIHRLYSWHFRYPLEREKMEQAAKDFIGTFDFTAFANEEEKNSVCTLEKITLAELPGHRLQISICGDRFLYKMARNIIGTLVYIGRGKMAVDCIPSLLVSRDRKAVGVTAPAHGLYLHKVFYK
ncbi:MAG TPA: tRNA pseudouridine(38-40) synthase TruA [Chlamydiales bacterium]|nr:tRNA pseudouridine(38-40) synthase TruA [Chlamydiales bacterium]